MIEFLVIVAIFLAIWVTIRLKYEIYGRKPCIILLMLFALVALPVIVLTTKYAYLAPEFEGSIVMSFFLSFHLGVVIASFLWTFIWITLGEAFIRLKLVPLTYFLFLMLFAGDLLSLFTWADNLHGLDIHYLAIVIGLGYTGLFILGLHMWKHAGKKAKTIPSSEQAPKKKKAKKK